VVLPYIEESQATLLRAELAYQNHVAESSAYAALPRGPVHADMFRDNVMFATGGSPDDTAPRLTGVFDFYFAGTDTWLFDLSVCLNDWAIDLPTGRHDAGRAEALLAAYETVRPLNAAERALLPAMLRAAALRFWISRLWDFHLPREASMLKPHDPAHFERVLRERAAHPHAMAPALEPIAA
jgi:homoserine kinase type II